MNTASGWLTPHLADALTLNGVSTATF